MDMQRFLQYIGARYVPKFYVNSQDANSSEWEANVEYEYMTWVSLPNGNMYLSKENVPATVGTPADNGRYWLAAGQFNAYIQQIQSDINDMKDGSVDGSLQAQIDELLASLNNVINVSLPAINSDISDINDDITGINGDITSINGDISTINTHLSSIDNDIISLSGDINKINPVTGQKANKVILITDSYGTLYPDGSTYNFQDYMKQQSAFLNANMTTFVYSGCGFIENAGGGTFQSLFAQETYANKSDVGIILVAAGRNDYSYPKANVMNAISNFVQWCKTNYPNARVKLAYIANGDNSSYGTKAAQFECYTAYRDSIIYDCDYITGSECIMKNSACMNSDGCHPTQYGRQMIAKYLVEGLRKGYCSVNYAKVRQTFTFNTGYSGALNATRFDVEMVDNQLLISADVVGQLDVASGTINLNGYTPTGFDIGQLSDGLVYYPRQELVLDRADVEVYYYSGNTTVKYNGPITCKLSITSNNQVHIGLYCEQSMNIAQLIFFTSMNQVVPAILN